MNQMNPAPENGAAKQGAPAPGAAQDPAAGAPAAVQAGASAQTAAAAQTAAPVQAGASAQVAPAQAGRATAVAGPFTVRDLLVFASALLLFVASLLPMFGPYNLWGLSNLFFLGLGIVLPLVVTALFVARRLQPQNPLRIGSLSVDQFASVVASFAVALYFLSVAGAFSGYLLLGLVGALALLAATVLAPHIPLLRDDFKDRAESTAHLVARDAVAPFRKPAAPKPAQKAAGPAVVPAAAGPVAGAPAAGGPFAVVPTPAASAAPPASVAPEETRTEAPEGGTPAAGPEPQAPRAAPEPQASTAAQTPQAPAAAGKDMPATMAHPVVDRAPDRAPETAAYPQAARPVEPIGATVDPASRPEETQEQAYEAFWFAVPQPRVAVDEHSGAPAFTIEPGGWVLALEDRGEEFLVQNTDGRLGVLRDLSHVERG
ncbi:hypothetical protein [Arthrobacter sp. R-11]|uniref:hypothetical protein n=1 Tax=Arthrobacter sp. R-11 TaxID=3404053 RepID=UPI003CFA2363